MRIRWASFRSSSSCTILTVVMAPHCCTTLIVLVSYTVCYSVAAYVQKALAALNLHTKHREHSLLS
jgi:hypothetical protein